MSNSSGAMGSGVAGALKVVNEFSLLQAVPPLSLHA